MVQVKFREQEKDVWEILKSHPSFFIAVILFALGVGILAPIIFCKYLHIYLYGKDVHGCLEHIYFLAGSFYSVIALFTLIAVLLAAYAVFEQLKSMQDQLNQNTNTAYQASRQGAWSNIISMTNLINNYIALHKRDIVHVPYPTVRSGQDTLVLLFHHIDLIYMSYINRKSITYEEWEGLERWVDKVFLRWIGSNANLFADFQTIMEFGDYYSEDFLKWLKEKNIVKTYEMTKETMIMASTIPPPFY